MPEGLAWRQDSTNEGAVRAKHAGTLVIPRLDKVLLSKQTGLELMGERRQITPLLTLLEQTHSEDDKCTSSLKAMVILTLITEEFNTINKIHLTLTF